jgi:hypothetical protein
MAVCSVLLWYWQPSPPSSCGTLRCVMHICRTALRWYCVFPFLPFFCVCHLHSFSPLSQDIKPFLPLSCFLRLSFANVFPPFLHSRRISRRPTASRWFLASFLSCLSFFCDRPLETSFPFSCAPLSAGCQGAQSAAALCCSTRARRRRGRGGSAGGVRFGS